MHPRAACAAYLGTCVGLGASLGTISLWCATAWLKESSYITEGKSRDVSAFAYGILTKLKD